MKKIAFYTLWTILCLHTTVSFTDAASGTVESALAQVDAIIASTASWGAQEALTLNSAPVSPVGPVVYAWQPQVWSSWELIHRTPMLQGFMWTGATANFITPAMYIGTPLETRMGPNGYNPVLGPTNYTECVRSETDASFWQSGSLIEKTAEAELMNIAKYCATEYYGTYFEGKKYTTREEMLMLLFTMFDEGVTLPGYFDDSRFVFEGKETISPYKNISPKAWFGAYLATAHKRGMVPSYTEWTVAKQVTESEVQEMIRAYSRYRTTIDKTPQIQTEYGYFRVDWQWGKLILTKNF